MMRPHKRGFTLIEILIVVIILGIIAAIVVPQLTSATRDANATAYMTDMQTIQSMVMLYQAQQNAYPTADGKAPGDVVWSKLTEITTVGGTNYGPYLQNTPKTPVGYHGYITAGGQFDWAN